MIFLPLEIQYKVIDYLSCSDKINAGMTHKEHKLLLEPYQEYISQHKKCIRRYFCEEIIDIVGGFKNMMDYEWLAWNDTFMGGTGYIDSIKSSDLQRPIMLGVDSWDRPFIAIKTTITNKYKKQFQNVDVLFQRFSNEKKTWTSSCSYPGIMSGSSGLFLNNGCYNGNNLRNNLQNLLNGNNYIQCDNGLISSGVNILKACLG